ncbi:MAG: quinolinate synthase NadA [Clostridiales bacterium]|jgi:quinolinate synthetase complex, A subunit|nr:quinolinate synthase NadA [Clostridiales bacterium]
MSDITNEIQALKRKRDAVILAHYYAQDEVQALADYVGDSYYLSKVARECPQQTLVFCGVKFMGESAKIMNPEKTVLMPDEVADCPMAHMTDAERIQQVRAQHPEAAVVCYINSTAEAKAASDVCVTSANAMRIVQALPNREIYFIPDENLARHIAAELPEKHFIFNQGYCHVHARLTAEMVKNAKEEHPRALVLAHPECRQEVLALADYIGSTSGIIEFATKSENEAFIVCTEMGVMYELKQKNPNKRFYTAEQDQICPDMKRITLEKIKQCLETMAPEVEVNVDLGRQALKALEAMHTIAR